MSVIGLCPEPDHSNSHSSNLLIYGPQKVLSAYLHPPLSVCLLRWDFLCVSCFLLVCVMLQLSRKIHLLPKMTSLWWKAHNFLIFCSVNRRLEKIQSGDLPNLFSTFHQIILDRLKWGRWDGLGMQHALERWEIYNRKPWREEIISVT
jgi:hypothetical protein